MRHLREARNAVPVNDDHKKVLTYFALEATLLAHGRDNDNCKLHRHVTCTETKDYIAIYEAQPGSAAETVYVTSVMHGRRQDSRPERATEGEQALGLTNESRRRPGKTLT